MDLTQAVRKRIAPRLRNSTYLYREVLEEMVSNTDRWLDLGCGHQLLPAWMADGEMAAAALAGRARLVVGTDQVVPAILRHKTISRRVAADIGALPFASGTFDLVTANMVVEHVKDGSLLLSEVGRVLTGGGRLILHTPNRLFYQVLATLWLPSGLRSRAASLLEGRSMDDVFPTHYRMNTAARLRALARAQGFEIERMHFVNSSLTMGRFPPLAIAELGIISLLETKPMAWARSNIVAVLRKNGRS
jgi:SAM-dependent methyltransferase